MNPEAKLRLSSLFSVKLFATSEDDLSITETVGVKRFSAEYYKQYSEILHIKLYMLSTFLNIYASKTLNYLRLFLLGLIILSSFALMLNASLKETAIFDETAHISAGYGYVKYFDYRLNPEHPPLVKVLAALPLVFQSSIKFPVESSAWQTDINGQWTVGGKFLYESGNNADQIVGWARLGPILLTIILIFFIYIWSKELIGRWWALLPTFLFALSPTVLAHGHYVTTDIGATIGTLAALYYFIKFLFEPSKKNLVFAGLAFGIAQLMKFSSVLIIPFFIFLITVFYFWKIYSDWQETEKSKRFKKFSICAFHYIKSLIIIFLIGYSLVYAVYFIFTVGYPVEKQQTDTANILTGFANGPDPNWETCNIFSNLEISRKMRCLAEIDIFMAGNKFLKPFAEYLLGVIMVIWRSSGGNAAYFLGELSSEGWWYYFPIVFVLKEPIPSLILILFALFLSIKNIFKNKSYKIKAISDYLGLHFAEFSMISFIIFYWLYSINSPLNIGIRHILPTIPFIYILTASVIKKWVNQSLINKKNIINMMFNFISFLIKISAKIVFILILLIWYLFETLSNSPYYTSYFNQFGGGIYNGYQYITDSNYDWGQDLKRLKNFVENPPAGEKIDKIAVDYFGGGNPKYYMGNKVEYWWPARGNPQYEGINWLAVSTNALQGALAKLNPNQPRKPEDEYSWLKKIKDPYKPDYKAGTSIFIYKL